MFRLVSCEILYREMLAAVARSPQRVDIEFLPKGLHDLGAAEMRKRLQAAIDQGADDTYQAVLLGYGLCGNGLAGLTARVIPLVVARAHDCVTLFLGGKERYLDYFHTHPGVYFHTTGWIERGGDSAPPSQLALGTKPGTTFTYEELVARYGEENARFLFSQLGDLTRHYRQLTFIEMGIEPDDRFERHSRQEAARRSWEFEKVRGDMSLIQRLVNGHWDPAEFLVVPPGARIAATYDGEIITAEEALP